MATWEKRHRGVEGAHPLSVLCCEQGGVWSAQPSEVALKTSVESKTNENIVRRRQEIEQKHP